MLQSLVAKALSYRLLVVALALAVAGLGAWAFVQLPVDAYPNIAQTQVKIILKAPGMTPEEVESRVIAPIEMEMLGIPRQSILRSSAKYAIADITIAFPPGADETANAAEPQQIRRRPQKGGDQLVWRQ